MGKIIPPMLEAVNRNPNAVPQLQLNQSATEVIADMFNLKALDLVLEMGKPTR
jgi:uncharacterized protein YbjT (DUF2867 family)